MNTIRYEQAVEYISRIPKFTKKNEAGNTIELLRRLSHPEREFRVIHIAGTNGKGSVCAFLESIFRKAGYRTGLFTSPHLVRINERFQTDRTPVSDEDFLEAFLHVMRAVEEMMADGYAHPTYFEFLFAAGMWYFREQKIDAVILPHAIDAPFISHLEQKNKDLKFSRIDADLNDAFRESKEEDSEEAKKQNEALAKAVKKAIGSDKLSVKIETLKDAATASILTVSEESRRMQDMMKQYGMDSAMFAGEGETLVLNERHPLVEFLKSKVVVTEKNADAAEATAEEETAKAPAEEEAVQAPAEETAEAGTEKKPSLTKQVCEQLYDLARIQHGSLSPERMEAFIRRSNEILCALTEK